MAEDYSLKEIIERNHKEVSEELAIIKAQTIKTNGTVQRHTIFIAQAKVILGCIAAILSAVVAPTIVNWLTTLFTK